MVGVGDHRETKMMRMEFRVKNKTRETMALPYFQQKLQPKRRLEKAMEMKSNAYVAIVKNYRVR